MRKKFIVFYDENGLIKNIGIWQRMNGKGNRMLIEFIDYWEMMVACNTNSHIDTRYKNRIVEQCAWMNTDDVFKSDHIFVELRDEDILKEKFAKSEMLRATMQGKGDGILNYDGR